MSTLVNIIINHVYRWFVFQIINEKEKIQAEINEQPYLFNTIRVKPLNSMKPEEIMKKVSL